jgi:tetratricopeptide (TPR) repeat protein
LDGLYQLTSQRLSQADFQNARRFAQQQLGLEPWREEAHRQVMQALAALGERTAALAQYETCRAILADELGVAPAPETSALAQRIREVNRDQPTQYPAERQRLTLPFVERQVEYEALVRAYQQATQYGLQIVTVQGQAGIGKTRLAEQWPILGELGRLYAEQGENEKAREAYDEATAIIHHLAETIDEADLRAGFLAAGPVRSMLERCGAV